MAAEQCSKNRDIQTDSAGSSLMTAAVLRASVGWRWDLQENTQTKKKSDSKQQQLTDTLETHCVTEEFESTRGCKQSCDFFCFESWIWNGFCSRQRGRLNKQHIKLCRWITKCYYRETSGNTCWLCPWKTKDVVSEQDSKKITSSPSSL